MATLGNWFIDRLGLSDEAARHVWTAFH